MRPPTSFVKSVLPGTLAVVRARRRWKLGTSLLVEGRYSPNLCIPWHRHPVTHCTCVLAGSYSEACPNSQASFQSGDLLFHPRGEIHSELIGGEGARCLNIEFVAGDTLAPALEAMNCRVAEFSLKLRTAARLKLSEKLATEWDFAGEKSSHLVQTAKRFYGDVCEFLWMAVREYLPLWMGKCIDQLAGKAPFALSLKELAGLVDLHPTHVVREFGRYLGQTPGKYTRARRVSLACELLSKEKCPLVEVALACGFYDQAHFGRVFRAITGETPGQYRDQRRGRKDGAC